MLAGAVLIADPKNLHLSNDCWVMDEDSSSPRDLKKSIIFIPPSIPRSYPAGRLSADAPQYSVLHRSVNARELKRTVAVRML